MQAPALVVHDQRLARRRGVGRRNLGQRHFTLLAVVVFQVDGLPRIHGHVAVVARAFGGHHADGCGQHHNHEERDEIVLAVASADLAPAGLAATFGRGATGWRRASQGSPGGAARSRRRSPDEPRTWGAGRQGREQRRGNGSDDDADADVRLGPALDVALGRLLGILSLIVGWRGRGRRLGRIDGVTAPLAEVLHDAHALATLLGRQLRQPG